MKKSKKHDEILSDYSNIKSRHLEKLATQILKDDKKIKRLKKKTLRNNFLNNF